MAFDDTPASAQRPLDESEIKDVLDNPKLLKDPRRAYHFAWRVMLTFRDYRVRIDTLRRNLEDAQSSQKGREHPIATASEALRNISEEERRQVMEHHLLEKIEALEVAERDAQRAQTAARSEGNRVRFALASVLEDRGLSAGVRDRIEKALAMIPEGSPSLTKTQLPENLVPPAPPVEPVAPPPAPPVTRAGSSDSGVVAPRPGTVEVPDDLSGLFDM